MSAASQVVPLINKNTYMFKILCKIRIKEVLQIKNNSREICLKQLIHNFEIKIYIN